MSNYVVDDQDFDKIVSEQVHACVSVLSGKAEEYAGNQDRLHNFRVAAALKGISMRDALAGMMAKHTISVYDLCKDENLADIPMWNEKITDHINYLLLLRAVVAEETVNQNQNTTQA